MSLSVGHAGETCKNGWTDRGAAWCVDSGAQGTIAFDWSAHPSGWGNLGERECGLVLPLLLPLAFIVLLFLYILGDDFPNAASLLEIVLELQAEQEQATVSTGTQDIRSDIPSASSAASVPEGCYA